MKQVCVVDGRGGGSRLVVMLVVGLVTIAVLMPGCSCTGLRPSMPTATATPSPTSRPTATSTPTYGELLGVSRAECASDTSLLTGKPCAPPCWQNLVPGESTTEQVYEVLRNNMRVRQDTIHDDDVRGPDGTYFRQISWGSCLTYYPLNDIYLDEGVVSRIKADLGGEITLGDVVDRLGSPEGMRVWLHPREVGYLSVLLYYPSLGITIHSDDVYLRRAEDDLRRREIVLVPELPATEAYYYVPGTLEDVLGSAFFYSPEYVQEELERVQLWNGFGKVKLE